MDKEKTQIKKALFDFVMKKDPTFLREENIIFAENAFLINSILAWYLDDYAVSSNSVHSVVKILEKHIQKELIIAWGEQGLRISSPLTDEAQDALLAEEL